MLGEAQSIALLVIGLLAIVILLRILIVVHHQTHKFKDLEMRMKAMEKMDVDEKTMINTNNDKTKG